MLSLQTIKATPRNEDLDRALQLLSESAVIASATASFPPREVANFLVRIFFQYAQTNYYYVDEQTMRQKLDDFFSRSQNLRPCDSSWICTILMVFAVGTQFAHLSSQQSTRLIPKTGTACNEDSSASEDAAGLVFYRAAKTIIPDVITLASVGSVQAFLLLGMYALPIDPAGLSYNYIGLAVKIAISNGMHGRNHKGMDARTVEIRNRLWWTAQSLEMYSRSRT